MMTRRCLSGLLLWCLCACSGRAHDFVDPARALAEIEAALVERPDDPFLRFERAEALLALDRFAEARQAVEQLVAWDPDNSQVHVFRASLHMQLRDWGRAEEDLSRALALARLAPEFDSFAVVLDRADVRERTGDLAGALRDLDAALRIAPYPTVFLRRGALLEQLGRLEQAEATYRDGLEAWDRWALGEALVDVLLRQGQAEEALELLEAQERAQAFPAPVLLQRARVCAALHQPERARQALRAAREACEAALEEGRVPVVELRSCYARVLARLGEREAAREQLQAALREDPASETARAAEWEILLGTRREPPLGAPVRPPVWGPPCLAVGLWLLVSWRWRRSWPLLAVLLCVAACGSGWLARQASVPSERSAHALFTRLHAAIYKGFAVDSEDALYAVLARSVEAGPLLDQIYGELYAVLCERQAGRVFVDIERVGLQELALRSAAPDLFEVDCRWLVGGRVTHQQHTHYRLNQYAARYAVRRDGDGAWKLCAVALSHQERLSGEEGEPSGFGLQDPADVGASSISTR